MVEQLISEGEESFGRTLRLYESQSGIMGRQYVVPGHGRIDLLAEDSQTNELVVIELKEDESHEAVVGQIAMYSLDSRKLGATRPKSGGCHLRILGVT